MSVLSKNKTSQRGFLQTIKSYLGRNRLGEILVVKGLISTQDLRFALNQQKQTNKPLGEIFLKHAMISRRQLTMILIRQTSLRVLAACMFFIAASGAPGKKARADSIKDVPAQITIASASIAEEFGHINSYPGLFGTNEKKSGNLSPFTKWTGMFTRFDRELKNPDKRDAVVQWQHGMESFKGLSLKKMADRVNTYVNKTRYILDNKNWGKSDYWATPVEFISRGGDCEDYAIAKYAALRTLGVPEERMRVAIVHDTQKNIPHAVLVVYTDEGTYILDNQNSSMLDGDSPGRYRPIFSINRESWWLHTAPDSGTIVASAR